MPTRFKLSGIASIATTGGVGSTAPSSADAVDVKHASATHASNTFDTTWFSYPVNDLRTMLGRRSMVDNPLDE